MPDVRGAPGSRNPAARAALLRGLNQLALDPGLADPLMAFLNLLEHWNRAYNLTAVRVPVDMVERHLLDSLAIASQVRGPRVLDVGTGAGLPGIPLVLLHPDWELTLLDSGIKKVRFLRQVVLELGLENVHPVHSRVENYHPDQGFDTVISRAFSATADFVALAGHLCAPGGQMLAMKGRHADDDQEALPGSWRVADTLSVQVPGLDARRQLVRIVRD